jgi:hypothetical protein
VSSERIKGRKRIEAQQEKRNQLCLEILQCLYAQYLRGYDCKIHTDMIEKYTRKSEKMGLNVLMPSNGMDDYQYALALLSGSLDEEMALKGTENPYEEPCGNILVFPDKKDEYPISQSWADEATYGNAWDVFDNILLELDRAKCVECKMNLRNLRSLIWDATMTIEEKQPYFITMLHWLSTQEENIQMVFAPIFLQYERLINDL